MQNPIGEADLEWILHRNCEGTEQLPLFSLIRQRLMIFRFPVNFPNNDTRNAYGTYDGTHASDHSIYSK